MTVTTAIDGREYAPPACADEGGDVDQVWTRFRIRFYVYRLWDGNEIVYIGSTDDLVRRLNTHRKRIAFSMADFVWVWDRRAAYNVERSLIWKHRPKYNRTGAMLAAKARMDVNEQLYRSAEHTNTKSKHGHISPGYLRPSAAARYCGMSVKSLRNWTKRRAIPSISLGTRCRLYSMKDLDAARTEIDRRNNRHRDDCLELSEGAAR